MRVHIVGGKFLGYDNMPTIWTLQENPNNAFLGELTVMLKRFEGSHLWLKTRVKSYNWVNTFLNYHGGEKVNIWNILKRQLQLINNFKLLCLVMGKNFFQKVRSTMFIPDSCLAPNTCICFETGLLTGTLGLTNEGLMTPTNQKFLNWLWESCTSICFTVSFKNIEENSVISTPWCKLWRKFTMCLVWHSKHHWHCERATLLKAKWKKKDHIKHIWRV